jgi:hypothetical protein
MAELALEPSGVWRSIDPSSGPASALRYPRGALSFPHQHPAKTKTDPLGFGLTDAFTASGSASRRMDARGIAMRSEDVLQL